MNEPYRVKAIARLFRFIRRYFLAITILLFIIWTAGFFELGRYTVYLAHPELAGAEQATAILNHVGKLIQLPSNETPTMATISDAASAKQSQPFLTNAENGDVLIVYANAQEALLYRPSTNKLIAVGPVDNSTTAANDATPAPQPVATTTNAATSTSSGK